MPARKRSTGWPGSTGQGLCGSFMMARIGEVWSFKRGGILESN